MEVKKSVSLYKGIFCAKAILMAILIVGINACVSDQGREDRPLVEKFGSSQDNNTPEQCTQVYDLTNYTCRSSCPTGTHLADQEERQQAIDELQAEFESDNISEEQYQEILGHINAASGGVCVQGSGVLRPSGSGAISINSDFCACKAGKPDIVNDCQAFCASRADANATLYGSVTLGAEVLLNEDLGSLERWCAGEITGSDLTSPACFLEVDDGSSVQRKSINIPPGSNSFTVNIESLNYETTYIATIIESQSGSNAKSSSFQIYRKEPQEDSVQGLLKIMSVSQYTCITRSASESEGVIHFEDKKRLHFYFASNAKPQALPRNVKTTVCHDNEMHGEEDSPLYPRLELIPQHFALWDQADSRFSDLDGDQKPDINQLIETRLKREAGITRSINTFSLFKWPNMPTIEGLNQVANPNVGFFMSPWIRTETGEAYCPGQDEYNNSNDPIFKILKELVGVDTEGIYFAESGPIEQASGSYTRDVIIMREQLLKKIWFYYEDNQHFIPDDISVASKTIRFYWPPDIDDPYIRKSTQEIYTIRHSSDIGKEGVTEGLNTSLRPPDRRFGCVPALD